MKYLILAILMVPLTLRGQFESPSDTVSIPDMDHHLCSYSAEETIEEILNLRVKKFLLDTVEFSVEKRGPKFTKRFLSSEKAEKRVLKVLKRGKPKFYGKSSFGFVFTLSVFEIVDETEILNFVRFEVDRCTRKISSIEILRGI